MVLNGAYTIPNYVLISPPNLVPDGVWIEREGQPCWCPDAFLEACFNVTYCPHHGNDPDPELWDNAVEPFHVAG